MKLWMIASQGPPTPLDLQTGVLDARIGRFLRN